MHDGTVVRTSPTGVLTITTNCQDTYNEIKDICDSFITYNGMILCYITDEEALALKLLEIA